MSNKVDLKNNQSNKKPKPADYLNIAICSLIMIFFFISMFFTTNGGVSQQEKRDLATFPKLSELTAEKFFSGDFLSQIDEFYLFIDKNSLPYQIISIPLKVSIVK